MNDQEALAAVREAFESVQRPELMIRGTCSCCECAEHNLTLLSHTPETITLKELGNAGWEVALRFGLSINLENWSGLRGE